jgi:hypothetical protein
LIEIWDQHLLLMPSSRFKAFLKTTEKSPRPGHIALSTSREIAWSPRDTPTRISCRYSGAWVRQRCDASVTHQFSCPFLLALPAVCAAMGLKLSSVYLHTNIFPICSVSKPPEPILRVQLTCTLVAPQHRAPNKPCHN